MAEDNALPDFYMVSEDGGPVHYVVASDNAELWRILEEHDVGCMMDEGDQVLVTRMTIDRAATLMVCPDESTEATRPLIEFTPPAFFSTEW